MRKPACLNPEGRIFTRCELFFFSHDDLEDDGIRPHSKVRKNNDSTVGESTLLTSPDRTELLTCSAERDVAAVREIPDFTQNGGSGVAVGFSTRSRLSPVNTNYHTDTAHGPR